MQSIINTIAHAECLMNLMDAVLGVGNLVIYIMSLVARHATHTYMYSSYIFLALLKDLPDKICKLGDMTYPMCLTCCLIKNLIHR